MINNFSSILWVLGLFFVAGFLIFAFWLNYYFRNYAREYKNISNVAVHIPEGLSLSQLSQLLFEKKIIDDAQTFYWYLRLRKNIPSAQAGIYVFDGKMSNQEVAERLQSGLLIM